MNSLKITVNYNGKESWADLRPELLEGFDLSKSEDRHLLVDRYLISTLHAALEAAVNEGR